MLTGCRGGAGLAGFVDMQTASSDLIENVGAIPFLDYKHFAGMIFFPEVSGPTADARWPRRRAATQTRGPLAA